MAFDDLMHEQFVVLTTVRRDGTPVPTTVWFAHHGDGIVIGTGSSAGKVKRIRNNAEVTIASSNYRGKLKPGPAIKGQAQILEGNDAGAALEALASKYGLQWKLFGRRINAFIEVTPSTQ
jgi:uncharacterized protein